MSDRKPTSIVLPAVVAALVLLGLYVGAYYSIVKRAAVPYGNGIGPMYRVGGQSVSRLGMFFAPMHWLDRRIRPHVWEPRR